MEFLIWLGFLIVYSILQSTKKKKGPKKVPTNTPQGESSTPTWGDALRQIQEALEEAQNPQPRQQPAPAPEQPQPRTIQEPSRSLPRERNIEPEFHSLERNIPDRRLESKTEYQEKIYRPPANTETTTYEDSFPDSSFYDEQFSHAHMEESSNIIVQKKTAPGAADILRKKLFDKNYLSEAFIINEILGSPKSKRK